VDRNLALEIVRVTEASALAAARWMGKGDALAADEAAVGAMHQALNSIPFSGTIAIGEGNQDSVPKLYHGEKIGSGDGDELDLVVDALECTKSVAFGRSNAMAVIALARHGDFFCPPSYYLHKLVVGPDAAEVIDMKLTVQENLGRVAEIKNYSLSDLTVVVLDRERNSELIEGVRKTGARIHLIPDGDVEAAMAAATPGSGIDVLMGTGGSAAGLLAAAALSCMGGEIQTRLAPTSSSELDQLRQLGHGDLSRVYGTSDLVRGRNVMFASCGVTDGDVLNGVSLRDDGAITHSLVLHSGTRKRRFIVTEHYFEDNNVY